MACTKSLVNEIDVAGKFGMSGFKLAKGAAERKVWLKQQGDC